MHGMWHIWDQDCWWCKDWGTSWWLTMNSNARSAIPLTESIVTSMLMVM
jgi:hypothetical protein